MKNTTMRAAIILWVVLASAIPSAAKKQNAVDHSIFDGLLARYVEDGLVDYQGWRENSAEDWQRYLDILRDTDPWNLASDNERLAFWINAYNAFTIEGVLKRYPLKTIRPTVLGIPNPWFWYEKVYRVNGTPYTLDAIEHKILRKEFREPRIHFAIVCASLGCPKLGKSAFTGANVQKMLDTATQTFMRDPEKVRFDSRTNTLWLSSIFNWFADDFREDAGSVEKFVGRYLPEITKIGSQKLNIDYLDYDWNLNSQ